jgi:transposase
MPYIQAMDREQLMMCSLDSFVEPESIARVIDVFVNGLDLSKLEFNKSEAALEGRPSYDPKCHLKIYLYGSRKSIRSSRKLAEACRLNVEVKWLTGGLEPDFRTISDFRKDNVDCLKKVFREFNHKLASALEQGFKSIDGSKFQANNSKDNNFTINKIDDRIAWLNQHTDEYLRQLTELDEADDDIERLNQFTKEELEEKLREAEERLERYKGYRKHMEENGLTQLSLTDPDAKLMKNKNGFMVAYNIQTAVDSETHLIDDYQLTNNVTDHGLLHSTMEHLKEKHKDGILEAVADKGYHVAEDMMQCLENGVLPHVVLPDGQDTYELEVPYEANECDENDVMSVKCEELKKCLRAGVVPQAYQNVIDSAEIIERKQLVRDSVEETKSPYGTEEEMKIRASEGYFVRDPERNLVICPAGEILRQKSIKWRHPICQ